MHLVGFIIRIYHDARSPGDRQRNGPKHVEFYSKNKSEKLVHLVGFIIRIYHDARSPGDRHRNGPKHVEFYSKNKSEKLVHLLGFIIRIKIIKRLIIKFSPASSLFLTPGSSLYERPLCYPVPKHKLSFSLCVLFRICTNN